MQIFQSDCPDWSALCVFLSVGGRKDKWKTETLTSSTKDSPP